MQILVTGAAGFIGSALVGRLIADGHDVTVLIRDGFCDIDGIGVVRGDLRNLPTLERAMVYTNADAVFHLAAQAIVPHAQRDPWNTFEDNVRGTYNILEAFRRHGKLNAVCIVASSDKAYGELGTQSSYDEGDPLHGRGPYDCSKSCADLIAQSYALEYNLRIAVVRAGNVYGPGDTHETRLIPSIVNDIVVGRAPKITSDGTPVRDYLYIDDAVDGYLAVQQYLQNLTTQVVVSGIPTSMHRAFNLSGGTSISVLALVNKAITAANQVGITSVSNAPIMLGTRTGEIQFQALNTTLARDLLRWSPRVGLFEGLKRTIREKAIQVGRISP